MKGVFLPARSLDRDAQVARDAGRLMLDDPDAAFQTAAIYSWREDTGLLSTREPGHWHRVCLEIQRRIDPGDDAGSNISADLQPMIEGSSAFVPPRTSRPELGRLGMVILACFFVAPLAAAPFAFHLAYGNGQFNFRPLTIRKNVQVISSAELADQNCAFVLRRTTRPGGVLHTTKKLVCND